MGQDTKYISLPFIFKSRGVSARLAIDRIPQDMYLNLANLEEREEETFSTRYGSQIIDRDPAGTGINNYFFTAPIINITRLKGLTQTYRYGGDSEGNLYRRAGDVQGSYTQIETGLSGNRFSSRVTTCVGSAIPYLFIADASRTIKDNGTDSFTTQVGITPPVWTMSAVPYGPNLTAVFDYGSSPTSSGLSLVTSGFTSPVTGSSGTPSAMNTFTQYTNTDGSVANAPDWMFGVDTDNLGMLVWKYNTQTYPTPYGTTFDVVGVGGAIPSASNASIKFGYKTWSIGANASGTLTEAISLNPINPNYSDDILVIFAFKVSSPESVQEIRIQFDVNSSGYTTAYYYKSITPQSFQNSVSTAQAVSPAQAIAQAVGARATGVTNLQQTGDNFQQIIPPDLPVLSQLQPGQITTGADSWTVVIVPLGGFTAVGTAGLSAQDWPYVTGARITVITNSQGSGTDFSFNHLSFLGASVGSSAMQGAAPNCYGGLGYDWRYTYYTANTQFESNPSPIMSFPLSGTLYTSGPSTLFPLEQNVLLQGQYSADDQVTHVRIYRRGGSLPSNWFYITEVPNATRIGEGLFNIVDNFPDSAVDQEQPLILTNDVPVTSTLQIPISTTLSAGITPTYPFDLTAVTVADATAVFVYGQIVNVGNPANLEQVYVSTPGTGGFSANFQLPHAAAEPVYAFSQPAIPPTLIEIAYGQAWYAGDPNNPHYLYYSTIGNPESVPPQNYIPVGQASDPIQAIINFRGTLFAATLTTWYQIYPGTPPYAQPTGSKHGLVASFAWTLTENSIWYLSQDGIREFRGADGEYRTLPIEWVFQNQPPTAVNLIGVADQSYYSNSQYSPVMAFWNNLVFFSYFNSDTSAFTRLVCDLRYGNRWRNDLVAATAMYLEADTNTLLYARTASPSAPTSYVIVEDRIGDYDDGGWSSMLPSAIILETPIAYELQTPYYDLGKPNNQKQFNTLTIDADMQGTTANVLLLFDDGVTTVVPNPALLEGGSGRLKYNFSINSGEGQIGYRMSVQISGSSTVSPILYQTAIEAAELAEQRGTFDSYWIKFGTEESKLVKQLYLDYTSDSGNPLSCEVFADGDTVPYYTFSLAANPNRAEVPVRVRLPAKKLRMFRLVIQSEVTGQAFGFQLWVAPRVEWKPVIEGKGYQVYEISTE